VRGQADRLTVNRWEILLDWPGGVNVKNAKQIVFHYNGNPAMDELIVDTRGEEAIPTQGTVILRQGKLWKVVMVTTEQTITTPQAIPVYRVFLTDRV
jgi:hypothetical protein